LIRLSTIFLRIVIRKSCSIINEHTAFIPILFKQILSNMKIKIIYLCAFIHSFVIYDSLYACIHALGLNRYCSYNLHVYLYFFLLPFHQSYRLRLFVYITTLIDAHTHLSIDEDICNCSQLLYSVRNTTEIFTSIHNIISLL
jgi:hypothetical protein